MKRILTFLLISSTFCIGLGQTQRARIPQNLQDIGVAVPQTCSAHPADNREPASGQMSKMMHPEAIIENTIGSTYFDLQTNKSNQNRFYRYPDGTMASTWIFGVAYASSFPDRGTGYNYFNGSIWGSFPTARIENVKVGWPSYAPLGTSGEIVVSHLGTTGLNISKRTTKGTGTWTHSTHSGPSSNSNLLWPRMITSGTTHNNIHIMAITAPIANAGTLYNGSDGALLYSRSTDGGATWAINNIQVPGTDTSVYRGLTGDCYAWAEPKGNTLAFVMGDSWYDLFLLKSTDNGANWTKTVIWQHPYPFFNTTTPTVTDTFYCPDGSIAAAIDNAGKVHVFFGVNRAYSEGVGTYWFPFVDGLGYWNEDMPQISSSLPKNTLHPDSLENRGQLAGYARDVNNNGSIDISAVGYYYLSVSSMPIALIDSNNHIFLVYSSVMEHLSNGLQNYRHLLGRKSIYGGSSWGAIVDLTGSIIHNFSECVFPSIAPLSNNKVHLTYQEDSEPGLAVRGDLDPNANNNIIYLSFDKTDLTHIPPGPQWTVTQTAFKHKIALPPLSGMLVNNTAITNGDYVGLFYNKPSGLACGGFKKINSPSDTIIAYGTEVGQNNGFAGGEILKWKIWKESTAITHGAFATYDPTAPNSGNFSSGGSSKVLQLKGGTVNVLASPGPTVCPGSNVNMQIIVTGGYTPYTYSWSPTTYLSNPYVANPVASPMQTTTYSLTVTDNIGLTGTASSIVNIIPPPAVSLAPFTNACDDWPPFQLSGGQPTGGTYSGNHVSGGMFNPTAAGQGNHMIIYKYTDPVTYCIGNDTSYVLVENCVYIPGYNENGAQVPYPNPFTDEIIIPGGHDENYPMEISLHYADGRQMNAGAFTKTLTKDLKLDTQALAPGLYILRIQHQGHQSTFKLVKTQQ